ncbi:cobalt-precorrin 5A hydrolase [Maridesulfovibrio hydrothermalis]|uniref:Cobalamin (Vitamin B12) biosynthesis CbiG protein n=1 Tax=Maridesulfovibrio hydrothermalis AM13 = DSM 14728 TaxID=1121451 RepID=L0R897_9BACT|nr:cobalamin biosynthesis protein [Maridesulfovibrio hydrothermalis]CCO22437.1 Cobalamin (Vitamin B12) biosynthesis CbiG protein [Maridesulfovibrio hydrothermalis AM13 = DSM 14728]
MRNKIAIYALTAEGAGLASILISKINADLFVLERYSSELSTSFTSLADLVSDKFSAYEAHIFIAASGIAVRMIAPHLKNKAADPAVVVLDQKGQFAVSLVSGHLGGANELARLIGDEIGAVPVITTATDCAGVPAIDLLARENNLVIGDICLIKHINAALLDGDQVAVYDPDGFLNISENDINFYLVDDVEMLGDLRCGVCVDWRIRNLAETVLPLYPRCLALGVGCRRGVPVGEILGLIRSTLDSNGVAVQSISCMGTIDAKSDEQGLIDAAEILGLELNFFSAAELDEIKVAAPSGMVMKHMGVGSVCEAAAMKMANATEILVPKTKSARVTAALAKDA